MSLLLLATAMEMAAVSITSPNGAFLLNVDVNAEGTPVYSLDYKRKPVIKSSRLGIVTKETDFTKGFHIAGTDTATVDRSW
ncbi:MAG: glycoside hydrolase family 97 N-terminal domain-containing protein, partial [Muribaculaceae bacterium]|nr:glycoside hydrolase family 97 N-terminal domain-containing protein [Muribaculaceae bacterium]